MRLPPLAAVSAGLLAAFVGFASSFTVVLQGLVGVGATPEQAASGIMALSVAMGLCGLLVSWRTKMPISIAWSTPGAALLAGAGLPEGGFAAAIGAFVLAAGLVILTGLVKPVGRAMAAIPVSLANAMLAGILLPLCLAPVKAVAVLPLEGLAIVAIWFAVGRWNRILAVPAAAVATFLLIYLRHSGPGTGAAIVPDPVLVLPTWSLSTMVGIGLPLFLITMASQNIPGLAVLKVNGYAPAPGPLFTLTGLFSLFSAPFGGHAVNLAAITAAICAGDEAGPDRARRWWAGMVSGAGYIAFGLAAGWATAFAAQSPVLIQAMAGLALIGAFAGALAGTVAEVQDREAAVLCFVVTASGTAFFGISAPFWGLAVGGLVMLATRLRRS
ncbi:benzoate/H(+) symporter BenE family transporter [Aureimonas ureilytica]|uniref:benzoate/H(+) symporter BenE family transporter n=1 Tax=Aureimonas ureilytica TaxID=401562 RepID=UPI00035DFADE|nr:benzoate/H(+) symporter BenE family transporter [Aureimonas ureilytica]